MGKTIIEKIFERHTEGPVRPGDVIWLEIDARTARDFGGPNVVKNYEREYDDQPLDDPKKTFFTFDLVAPAKTIKYANNQQICRNFAAKHGIKVYDVGEGIGSHIMIEQGIVTPFSTAVGTDSHYNILGAVGAFGQGMGDVDITFVFRTGKTWFEVPKTIRIHIKGKLEYPLTAKDLTLYILRQIGTREALGRAIEFTGEAIKNLSLAGRITLSSMVTEMAGIIGFPEEGYRTKEELEKLTGKKIDEFPAPDPDAEYEKVIEIDITGIKPQVAAPPNPTNVKDVDELRDVKVDTVFIGSCTNGRTEDIVMAAKLLKGRKIKEGVRLNVVPATRKVWGELLFLGVLQDLYESGAIIANPSCGGCAQGHIGMTGKGEVQISTSNRNFPGKQGDGPTYLAGPLVAAASALLGRIASPEEVL